MEWTTKKLLNGFKALTGNTGKLFGYDPYRNCFRLIDSKDSEYDCSWCSDAIEPHLKKMAELDFITEKGRNTYQLGFRGLHPYYVRWEIFRDFMLKSVVTPIIVAFITSLLTLFLLEPLKEARQSPMRSSVSSQVTP